MDFALIFARLFPGENVHPRAADVGITYADLANAKWRGSSPIPSLADCQSAWDAILVDHPELALPIDQQQAAIDKRSTKDLMSHTTPLVRLMRSSDRVTYQSVIQVRQAFNGLLAILAQGRFPTTQEASALKLPIRTWAQLKQATQNVIDSEDPAN
jgi:hypothetical protein